MEVNKSPTFQPAGQAQVPTALKGILKEGKKEVGRLKLSNDPTLAIAAKILDPNKPESKITKFLNKHLYSKITIDNKEYLINIRSTAKRLGITHNQVTKLDQEKLTQTTKTRETVLAKYTAVANSVKGQRPNFSPKTFLKVVQSSIDDKGNFIAGKVKIKGFASKKTFFVTTDLTSIASVDKRLGKGGFGKVYAVKVFGEKTSDQPQIVKQAIKNKEGAVVDLKNETKILKELGPHEGIQSAPKEAFEIKVGKSKESAAFYIADRMSSDLAPTKSDDEERFMFVPVKHQLKLCGELLNGLSFIHEKGYVHGDIKPGNCLMKMDAKGMPEKFVISDFGGAVNTKQSKEKPTSTPVYSPSGEPYEKRDVFAMSLTIIEILLDEYVNIPTKKIDDEKRPLPQSLDSPFSKNLEKRLTDLGIDEGIARLLLSGISPPDSRPTSRELHNQFQSFLAKK